MPSGKISPELEAVLRDKKAAARLRSSIASGRAVKIRVGHKTYRFSSKGNRASKSASVKSSTSKN